jgi:TatD DNase family protein
MQNIRNIAVKTTLVDIHTHHLPVNPGQAILNISPIDFTSRPGEFYSVGYHPWHLSEDGSEDWSLLSELVAKPEVLAVGEAGLDKVTAVDYSLQKTAFERQARIAMEVQKPLIIHCVRSYNEIIAFKKAFRPANPWIIHGFRGNKEQVRQLTDHGIYISYGFHYQEAALQAMPMDMLFLETDENDSDIHRLYEQVTAHLSLPISQLTEKIQENINNVFFK